VTGAEGCGAVAVSLVRAARQEQPPPPLLAAGRCPLVAAWLLMLEAGLPGE